MIKNSDWILKQALAVIAVVIFSCSYCLAQTDTLKVYDVALVHNYGYKFKVFDTVPNPGIDSLKVIFKLNHPENTERIYVSIGSVKDSGDVRSGAYDVIFSNGEYSFVMNGNTHKIYGSSGYCTYALNAGERQVAAWVTIYAEDNSGYLSERKYYPYK